MKFDKNEKKSSKLSFIKYALNGIAIAAKEERNFVIHLIAAGIAVTLGFILKITMMEWILLLLTIGSVLSLEVINTSIERIMDFLVPEMNPKVKIIKDLSAGAVFISACISACIACLLFLPKVIVLL